MSPSQQTAQGKRRLPRVPTGFGSGDGTAFAWFALVGALAATVGDFGQLWVVNSARPALQLAAPPPWGIVASTLAGALGIPLYALGYLSRVREVRAVAPRRAHAVAVFGCAFAAIGASVHATTGVLIQARVGEVASGLDPLQGILASGPIVSPLWALGGATFLVAAICEVALPQPPLRRLASPLLLTVGITLAASALPLPARDIIAPASINLAHLIFFGAGIIRQRSRELPKSRPASC